MITSAASTFIYPEVGKFRTNFANCDYPRISSFWNQELGRFKWGFPNGSTYTFSSQLKLALAGDFCPIFSITFSYFSPMLTSGLGNCSGMTPLSWLVEATQLGATWSLHVSKCCFNILNIRNRNKGFIGYMPPEVFMGKLKTTTDGREALWVCMLKKEASTITLKFIHRTNLFSYSLQALSSVFVWWSLRVAKWKENVLDKTLQFHYGWSAKGVLIIVKIAWGEL